MAIMTGEPIRSVDFLPNQLYLILTSQANSILVWDIRNTKVYKEFIHINQSSVPDSVALGASSM
jgi:WD40 repeat protein